MEEHADDASDMIWKASWGVFHTGMAIADATGAGYLIKSAGKLAYKGIVHTGKLALKHGDKILAAAGKVKDRAVLGVKYLMSGT